MSHGEGYKGKRRKNEEEEKREIEEEDWTCALKDLENFKKICEPKMAALEKAIKERNNKEAYELADRLMGEFDCIRSDVSDEPYGC